MNNIAQVHSQSCIHDSQQLSKASRLQRPGGSLSHPRREYLEMCDDSIIGLGERLLVNALFSVSPKRTDLAGPKSESIAI